MTLIVRSLTTSIGSTLCVARLNTNVGNHKLKKALNSSCIFIKRRFHEQLQFRDVFIVDDTITMDLWDAMHEKNLPLKHPLSGHLVSKYVSYIHKYGEYNYNKIGDYSLNITPIKTYLNSENNINHSNNQVGSGSILSLKNTHSIYLYPEGLCIRGLREQDIPTISQSILNDVPITRSNIIDCLQSNREINKTNDDTLNRENSNTTIIIDEVPKLVVIASSNKITTQSKAKSGLNIFYNALFKNDLHTSEAEIDGTSESITEQMSVLRNKKENNMIYNSSEVGFFIASDMKGHRNAASLLIFHENSKIGDGFEFLPSISKANEILSKYL